MKVFKFIIHRPERGRASDSLTQRCSIVMSAPHIVFPYEGLDDPRNMRIAKAELKIAMIEALINGEWEFED